MNAYSCREVSGDSPHHAALPATAHVARAARRGLRRLPRARAAGGILAACLGGLLATASAPAQERILSDVAIGPTVAAPDQPLPGEAFAGQLPADLGQELLPGEGGVGATIEENNGEYTVGDIPKAVHVPATRCQRWTAQVDALMLWQGAIPSRPLFVDPQGGTVLDANQAQPPVSIAPRYALIYNRDACRALEINYFQVQSFAGQASVPMGAGQYEMFNLAGLPFTDIDTAQVATTGQIKSLEFNLRRSHDEEGVIRWLAGFRWVEWNQTMTITDTFTDVAGLPGTDSIGVATGNNLYGGQLGADMMLWNAGRGIKFNGIAKGGVFYNHQAYQTTSVGGDRGISESYIATADAPAFVGEVGFNGSVALTKWLSWRAGYTCFWLAGVATPASQLGATDVGNETTGINCYSSVLLHGVTTGLEARW